MGRRVDVQNASTRARGEYAQALAKIEEAGVCPFCEEHLPKHHGKPILFSNAHWIVTENAWPYEGTRHQFVLIAREHIESAEVLPSEAWEALGSAYRRLVSDYQLEGRHAPVAHGNDGVHRRFRCPPACAAHLRRTSPR
jgi:hypothetical protein